MFHKINAYNIIIEYLIVKYCLDLDMCMCVVNTDIGCSDHFLVWMELGLVAKTSINVNV